MNKKRDGVGRVALGVALLAMVGFAVTAGAGPPFEVDARDFVGVYDPAREYFASGELERISRLPAEKLEEALDVVYRLEHDVPIGSGMTMRVQEHYTLRSWLRQPRRGVLFLSGSAFKGDHWSIPVEHYDATAMAARRGMFAFTVDFLGVGASSKPAEGGEVTFEANVAASFEVLRYVRSLRHIPHLDLVGAGYGGSVATQLAQDPGRTRSCVMTAMLYLDLIGGPLTNPDFVRMLQEAPHGYAFVPGPAYLPLMTKAPQEVRDYVLATQPGFYPALNFLEALSRPFFDPSVAKVPGLVIYGPLDFVTGPEDPIKLARDYGRKGAELLLLEGAGHAPRTEGPEVAARFWKVVFDFIDPAD